MKLQIRNSSDHSTESRRPLEFGASKIRALDDFPHANLASLRRLPRAVLYFVGHGGRRLCVEPAAHPAVDARRQTAGQGPAWLSGKAGRFSLDDPGRQHAGKLCGGESGGDRAAPALWLASRRVLGDFFSRRFFLLRDLRVVAQNAFSRLSEPPMHGVGWPVPGCARYVFAAGSLVEPPCARAAALDRGSEVHRAFIWHTRRVSSGDAGIGAGVHFGGTGDDQPRARPATFDCGPNRHAAGKSGDGDDADPDERGASVVPRAQPDAAAGLAGRRRSPARGGCGEFEDPALSKRPGREQNRRRLREARPLSER